MRGSVGRRVWDGRAQGGTGDVVVQRRRRGPFDGASSVRGRATDHLLRRRRLRVRSNLFSRPRAPSQQRNLTQGCPSAQQERHVSHWTFPVRPFGLLAFQRSPSRGPVSTRHPQGVLLPWRSPGRAGRVDIRSDHLPVRPSGHRPLRRQRGGRLVVVSCCLSRCRPTFARTRNTWQSRPLLCTSPPRVPLPYQQSSPSC